MCIPGAAVGDELVTAIQLTNVPYIFTCNVKNTHAYHTHQYTTGRQAGSRARVPVV